MWNLIYLSLLQDLLQTPNPQLLVWYQDHIELGVHRELLDQFHMTSQMGLNNQLEGAGLGQADFLTHNVWATRILHHKLIWEMTPQTSL